MRATGACGRADLVRALASGDPDTVAVTAELLGYACRGPARVESPSESVHPVTERLEVLDKIPEKPPAPLANVPFWLAANVETVSEAQREETPVEAAEVTWDNRPTETPPIHPLAPWRELIPRLRGKATALRETKDVDVAAVVRRLSRGELLQRVPRAGRHPARRLCAGCRAGPGPAPPGARAPARLARAFAPSDLVRGGPIPRPRGSPPAA